MWPLAACIAMKKHIIFLIPLFSAVVIFFSNSCQHSTGQPYGNQDYSEAKAYFDSIALHKDAILSSPETRVMAKGLDDFFARNLGSRFNGAMLVARKGVVIYEKYQGYANLSDKSPITRETTFQLASTSKPFTAMGILFLQQKGLLSINDPIQKYFPDLKYPGVTLKTLMNHRSGLPKYLYFCDQYWQDASKLMTNQDVIDIMVKYHPPAYFKADTKYGYCNTNYALLGSVIEKVSGMSLDHFLKKTFFAPLGMKHTYLFNPNTDEPGSHQSSTYDYRGRPIPDQCFDGVVGDKNVYSTVDDLLKWDQALYSGKLFTPATLDAAYAPYSHEHAGIKNYGLGWHLLVYPNEAKVVYHNGWWHGNTSVFYRFIDDSTTLIIMSNRFNKTIYNVQPLWKILHEASFETADDGES